MLSPKGLASGRVLSFEKAGRVLPFEVELSEVSDEKPLVMPIRVAQVKKVVVALNSFLMKIFLIWNVLLLLYFLICCKINLIIILNYGVAQRPKL